MFQLFDSAHEITAIVIIVGCTQPVLRNF
jgi:hypothetical protein